MDRIFCQRGTAVRAGRRLVNDKLNGFALPVKPERTACYIVEAASSVIKHCPEYKAFYEKKYAEMRTHQHKRTLALTSRKFICLLFGLLDSGCQGLPRLPPGLFWRSCTGATALITLGALFHSGSECFFQCDQSCLIGIHIAAIVYAVILAPCC